MPHFVGRRFLQTPQEVNWEQNLGIVLSFHSSFTHESWLSLCDAIPIDPTYSAPGTPPSVPLGGVGPHYLVQNLGST